MAALSSYLENDRKWDLTEISIGPLATHHRRELVKTVGQNGAYTPYQRMDGTQFDHRMGQPAPEPERVA